MLVQGVPKGMDTFQSLIIKKLDNLRKFFRITKTSIKCHFFNIFGKTVNLNFNGLTGVNSLSSIYFNKDAKKNIHQTYLITVKLPNLAKNGILSNFDLHGWPSKSDIFWVMAAVNSQICSVSSGYPEIREFLTAITQNILHLESQPWDSKLFRMPLSIKIRQFDSFQINLIDLVELFFCIFSKISWT